MASITCAIQKGELYIITSVQETNTNNKNEWFAIKTRQVFKAETELFPLCEEVFIPKEVISVPGKKKRLKAVIPHIIFIKTTESNALELERNGREHPELSTPFWIYRYPQESKIQPIPQSSIRLLRLLTADSQAKCRVFNKKDFKEHQRVRITEGYFQGYEGSVVRVKKNKHVVVKIDGVCLVMLPFIHPDFLETID